MSDGLGEVSDGLRKTDGLMKVSHGLGTVSYGLRNVYVYVYEKLDGVGPVDNRRSTN